MSDDRTQDIIDETAKESRGKFDLKARLQNRALREGSVTLYTDDKLGERLGDHRTVEHKNALGIIVDTEKISYGIIGALGNMGDPDSDEGDDAKTRAALEAERDLILKELDASALTVNLRAIPQIVMEDAKRKARVDLGIKGKVPEGKQEEFNRAENAHILASAIVSIKDHESGLVDDNISVEDVRDITAYLPASEYVRLSRKLNEVLFRETVAESAVSQADFSPAG